MRFALVVTTFGLLVSSIGRADASIDCATLKSAYERRDCTRQRYELSDQELNRVYQIVIRKLKNDNARRALHQLREVQRGWIKIRDERCQAEAKDLAGGGTEEIRAQFACVDGMTRQRTQELKAKFRVR